MNNLNGFQQIGNNLQQRNQQLLQRQQMMQNGTNPQLQQQLMMQQMMMQRQMLGQPLGQTKPFLTTEDRLNVLMNLKVVSRQPNMDENQLTQATLNLEKQIHDAATTREAYAQQVNLQIMARRQVPSQLQQIQLLVQQQYSHLPPQQQAQLVMQFQQKQQQLIMQMRQQNQLLNTTTNSTTTTATKETEESKKDSDGLTIALQAENLSVEDQQQVIAKMREIAALFPHIDSWLQIIQAKSDEQLTSKLTGMKKLAEAQLNGLKQNPPVFYLSVENVVKLQAGLLRFNAYMQQLRQMSPSMNNQMMNGMSPPMSNQMMNGMSPAMGNQMMNGMAGSTQMMNSPMMNAMSPSMSNMMMNGMSPPISSQMMNGMSPSMSNQVMNGMSPPMINQMMSTSTPLMNPSTMINAPTMINNQQLNMSPSMQKGQMNLVSPSITKNQMSPSIAQSMMSPSMQSMMMTNQAMTKQMNNVLHKSPMLNNSTLDNGIMSPPLGNGSPSMQHQTVKTNNAIPSPPKPSPRITPNQCSPNMSGSIMPPNVSVNNPVYLQSFLQTLQLRNHSLRQQLQQLMAQQQQYQTSGLPPQQLQHLLVENQTEQTKVRMLMNQIQMQWNQVIQNQNQNQQVQPMKKPVSNETKDDFWNDLFSVETPVEAPTEKPKEEELEEEINLDSLFDFNYSPTSSSVKRPREEEDCFDLFVKEERNVKSRIEEAVEEPEETDHKTLLEAFDDESFLEAFEKSSGNEQSKKSTKSESKKSNNEIKQSTKEKTSNESTSSESKEKLTNSTEKPSKKAPKTKTIKLKLDLTQDAKLIIDELNATKDQFKFTTETKEKENKIIINCSLDKITIQLHLSNNKNLLSLVDTKFGLELVECDDLTIQQQMLQKVQELREKDVRITHVLELVESVLGKS